MKVVIGGVGFEVRWVRDQDAVERETKRETELQETRAGVEGRDRLIEKVIGILDVGCPPETWRKVCINRERCRLCRETWLAAKRAEWESLKKGE